MTLYKYLFSGASTVLELAPQHSEQIDSSDTEDSLVVDSESLNKDWTNVGQDIYNSLSNIEAETASNGS